MEPAESAMPLPRWQQLRDAGIAELRAGKQARACELLTEAVALNAQDVMAWLWLSGVVATPGEQRFCLERVLELQPGHPDAQRGLRLLGSVTPRPPLPHAQPAVPAASELPPPSALREELAIPAAVPRGAAQGALGRGESLVTPRAGIPTWALVGITVALVIGLGAVVVLTRTRAQPTALTAGLEQPTASGALTQPTAAPNAAGRPTLASTAASALATAPPNRPTPAPAGTTSADARTATFQALRIERNGDSQGALKLYDAVIQAHPDAADAYFYRGDLRLKLGDEQGGRADYQHAQDLDPDPAKAAYHWGRIRADQGASDEALASFDKAIQLNPAFDQAYYARAVMRSNGRDWQGALADYTQTIAINPDFAEAYYNRGNLRRDTGHVKDALADFTEAVRADPAFVDAYFNRGDLYYRMGSYQQAFDDYSKAIDLKPDFVKAYCERGATRNQLGDYQGAIKDTTRARDLQATAGERAGTVADL